MINETQDKELLHRQRIIAKYFGLVILDLPYVISIVLMSISWRTVYMWRRLVDCNDVAEKRAVASEFMYLIALDVPAIIFAAIILLTGWHTRNLWKDICERTGLDRHKAVFKHTVLWIQDLPYMLITFVTTTLLPWRNPFLYWEFGKCQTNDDKRSVAFSQLLLGLFDIPTFLAGIVVVGTLWKLPATITETKAVVAKRKKELQDKTPLPITTLHEGVQIHYVIWNQFALLLADIPFGIMLIPLFIFHWRFITF